MNSYLTRLPRWLSGKESACNAGDVGLIPGSERSPGEGNDNLLYYLSLGNPMDRGAWWASPRGCNRVGHNLVTKQQVQFSSVAQLCLTLSTPWTAARQASLSITNSRSLLKLTSIESLMPSNHLILCHPLLLLPSIFPSISIFSNELVGVSASASILPLNIQD